MLAVNDPMFLLIPDPTAARKRTLRPGKVVESTRDGFVAEFEEPIAPEAGSSVNAYCEVRGKFFQQAARVAQLRATGGKPVIAFDRVGEPVSAEHRQIFRVVVVTEGITANVGKERNCPVVDISPVGFSLLAKGTYAIGSQLEVQLSHEGRTLADEVRVQTVKVRPDGRLRYGVLVLQQLGAARKWLAQTSAVLQRLHLRRLAGTA